MARTNIIAVTIALIALGIPRSVCGAYLRNPASEGSAYNMHAPYVEEKHPGSMFTYNPKAFGQGAQAIIPHPLYANPMQTGIPPKTLLPNQVGTGQAHLNAAASSVNIKNRIGIDSSSPAAAAASVATPAAAARLAAPVKTVSRVSTAPVSAAAAAAANRAAAAAPTVAPSQLPTQKDTAANKISSTVSTSLDTATLQKKYIIAGSYGNSPQALNVVASQQPAALYDQNGKPTMIYTKRVSPIWGHAGLGLPPSPVENPDNAGKKNGYYTSGFVNNVHLYGAATPDKTISGKGISPAMYGISATTFQEVPGSPPRPISAPGYPYAKPAAIGKASAYGPKHNPYFPQKGESNAGGNTIDDSNQDVEDHEEVEHHEDLLYRL